MAIVRFIENTLRWCILGAMKQVVSALANLFYGRQNRSISSDAYIPSQKDWDRLFRSIDEKSESIKKQLEAVRQQQAGLRL